MSMTPAERALLLATAATAALAAKPGQANRIRDLIDQVRSQATPSSDQEAPK